MTGERDNVVDLSSRRREASDRIPPRPVFLRMLQRRAGRTMGNPTEAERHDAILVLQEGPGVFADCPPVGFAVEGDEDPLLVEAQLIMDEATSAVRS